MNRAWAVLDIKEVSDPNAAGKRTFKGIASTPTTDRMDDIVEPKGAIFKLPIPLLWQHKSSEPIGWVTSAKVTDAGIAIEGEVADIPEEGELKDKLTMYWQYIKNKLVRGLSIGFNPKEHSQIDGTWGFRYTLWEWLELSAVTIPANSDCSITSIKAFGRIALRRAASGSQSERDRDAQDRDLPPGVSGPTKHITKGHAMSIAERLAAKKAERSALMKRAEELITKKTGDGDGLNEAEEQEHKDIVAEVKKLDDEIGVLQEHLKLMAAEATQVNNTQQSNTTNDTLERGAAARVPGHILAVRRNLPKGTAFTRFAMAMAHSKGNLAVAHQVAKRFRDTPEVEQIVQAAMNLGSTDFAKQIQAVREVQKAASDAGTTLDATWAGPLVYYENMQAEFIDLLRPKTIIGRLTGLRTAPFNIRVASKTSGSTVGWVGEGAPKPVGELAFGEVRLGHAKAAGIIVMTQELARFSSPSAEALVRDDMIDTMRVFLDAQFIDPAVAAVADVSPASVTNGSSSVPSTGATLAAIDADVKSLFALYYAAEIDPSAGYWVMRPGTALNLSMVRTTQGDFAYPTITPVGGTFFGLPVITSNSVPGSVSGGSIMALVVPNEIWLADDGNVTIDVSQEASVQMNTAPSAGAQSLVSLWQNNLIGVRAEREINWKKRRAAAVAYVDGIAY